MVGERESVVAYDPATRNCHTGTICSPVELRVFNVDDQILWFSWNFCWQG